jgi:hypothetical protein
VGARDRPDGRAERHRAAHGRADPLRRRARDEIERVEAAVLAAIQGGTSLADLTNLTDHVAALRRGEPSALAITPPE